MQDDRYGRHALIDWFSQPRVQSARFVVAGAGAIGNEVIKNLTLLGAGHIAIHDFDRIERHNLTRSVLFREHDVGGHKAAIAAARARELDQAVQAVAVPGDFWETLSFEALRRADCVIGCVDNFEARIRLNRLCRIAGTNLIDVAIDSRRTSVEVFPFASRPDCACYECTLPPGVYERIAQRYSCSGLRRLGLEERRIPTTILTSSTAGALAVSAAMRLLHAPQETTTARRVVTDTISFTTSVAPLERAECCPGCGDLMSEIQIIACDPVVALNLAAAAADPDVSLRMSDALITGGSCAACGHTLDADLAPRLRVARGQDERLSHCRRCGSDVAITVQDQFTPAELCAQFAGVRIPARFAVFDAGDTSVVLDFLAAGTVCPM